MAVGGADLEEKPTVWACAVGRQGKRPKQFSGWQSETTAMAYRRGAGQAGHLGVCLGVVTTLSAFARRRDGVAAQRDVMADALQGDEEAEEHRSVCRNRRPEQDLYEAPSCGGCDSFSGIRGAPGGRRQIAAQGMHFLLDKHLLN
ncbi:hypothetical protein DLJ59_11280 [Micromonospora inaquosa]|uniref:Uncharacterized protein n=1 Tax=Micromonospora inaquosa TaxID=2203716 RepID=A0A3N9X900_9ACTN|nr:hypothetical protein DLJ59_11280 [Micromonospora inaquosa]